MIFFLCALTVIIETPFLMLCGYRKRDEVSVIACVNVITNLILNLLLMYILQGRDIGAYIYLLEGLVVAVEYLIYSVCFGGSLRLAALTLAANCLSYGLGQILF